MLTRFQQIVITGCAILATSSRLLGENDPPPEDFREYRAVLEKHLEVPFHFDVTVRISSRERLSDLELEARVEQYRRLHAEHNSMAGVQVTLFDEEGVRQALRNSASDGVEKTIRYAYDGDSVHVATEFPRLDFPSVAPKEMPWPAMEVRYNGTEYWRVDIASKQATASLSPPQELIIDPYAQADAENLKRVLFDTQFLSHLMKFPVESATKLGTSTFYSLKPDSRLFDAAGIELDSFGSTRVIKTVVVRTLPSVGDQGGFYGIARLGGYTTVNSKSMPTSIEAFAIRSESIGILDIVKDYRSFRSLEESQVYEMTYNAPTNRPESSLFVYDPPEDFLVFAVTRDERSIIQDPNVLRIQEERERRRRAHQDRITRDAKQASGLSLLPKLLSGVGLFFTFVGFILLWRLKR